MASQKPALKVSMFVRKLPTISDEQFHAHWKGQHVDIAKKSVAFIKSARKYNQVTPFPCSAEWTNIRTYIYFYFNLQPAKSTRQVHITPELRAEVEALGAKTLDYDGIAEIWVDSIEDWKQIVSDPEFISTVSGTLLFYFPERMIQNANLRSWQRRLCARACGSGVFLWPFGHSWERLEIV